MRLAFIALVMAVIAATPALAGPLVVHSWGEFYPTQADAPPLDFSCSRFALPVNGFVSDAVEKCLPLRANDVNFAAGYILEHRYKADADSAMLLADQIVDGWERATLDYDAKVPLALLLAVYRYESGLDPTARNIHSGAYGLPQLMERYHKQRLTDGMGLDWHSPADQTYYATWHVDAEMDKGRSLYSACSWWTVRPKAWREYNKIKREGE